MNTTFWARSDSNKANNPALNLKGDPATQITFVPSGTNGDLFFDYANGGIDPDTQVSIGGVTYNFTFELSATLPTTKNNGSQQVPDQYEGSTVYIITVQDYPVAGQTTRLTFMPDENATQAEMNAFGTGAIDLQALDRTTTGAVCFAGGTHILTLLGEVRVEDLCVGDLVVTRDHGPKPILWLSTSQHAWPGSPESELPILVSAGALGPNKPHRDLIVSPQHNFLVLDESPQGVDEKKELFAPSKGLTSLPGIREMKGKREVVYFHILLERHEVVLSEGVATESFFPGRTALGMLRRGQREQVYALFPRLKDGGESGYGPRARDCLTVKEARLMARRIKFTQNAPSQPRPYLTCAPAA